MFLGICSREKFKSLQGSIDPEGEAVSDGKQRKGLLFNRDVFRHTFEGSVLG